MTAAETKSLHDGYRTIPETYAKHKARGARSTLTEERESEGSILSFWALPIVCVKCGDGVKGPDGAPRVPYK